MEALSCPRRVSSMLAWLGAGLVLVATFAVNRYVSWVNGLDAESGFAAAQCIVEDPSTLEKLPKANILGEASKTLSIILPAYNEDGRIQSTLTEALTYLQRRRDREGPGFTYEVIVADDGSKDATSRVAMEFVRQHGQDTVKVVRLTRNKGKAYAIRCGMLVARGQFILFADADGATPVQEVEKLEAAANGLLAGTLASSQAASGPIARNAAATMRNGGMAFVLGSRAHLEAQAVAKRTFLRNFLMHGFHFAVMMVVGSTVKDTQCGFKLMTRPAARLLFGNQRLQRWCFDVELVYLAEQLHLPMSEASVNWTEIPGSKVKLSGVVLMALELVTVRAMYSVLQRWQIRCEADIR